MAVVSARLALPVESVMSRRVVQVLEGIPMAEVHGIVQRYDYNGFPVVTNAGRLVGMITKGDLLRVADAGMTNPGVWAEPVSRWMAHGVVALRPMEPLAAAVQSLVEHGLRSLPVIDAEARVIGILPRNDLMSAIAPKTTASGPRGPRRMRRE